MIINGQVTLLSEALATLREYGWVKCVLGRPEIGHCSVGALVTAAKSTTHDKRARKDRRRLEKIIKEQYSGPSSDRLQSWNDDTNRNIFLWNDASERTFDEVVMVFEKAIIDLYRVG